MLQVLFTCFVLFRRIFGKLDNWARKSLMRYNQQSLGIMNHESAKHFTYLVS